jgi:hypothetical protein
MKVKIKEKYENISFINITDVYNYSILKIIDKSKYIVLISEIKEPIFFEAEPELNFVELIPGLKNDTDNAFTEAPFPAIQL